jgi:hypothetical protein
MNYVEVMERRQPMNRRQLNRVLLTCLEEEIHPNRVFRLFGSDAFEAQDMQLEDADLVAVMQEYLEAYGVRYLGMTKPKR